MSNKVQMNAKGIARYPAINRPDTKFDDAGVYKVDLILEPEEAEPIRERLAELQEEIAAEEKKRKKGKRVKLADLPIQPELDDDGEPTGKYILKVKSKATGVNKKTGEHWNRTIPIFDAGIPGVRKPEPVNVKVGGGSLLNVSFLADPYYSAQLGAGVTCRLEAVQVLELREGGGKSADRFGFGAEEGGYVSDGKDDDDEPPFDTDDENEGDEEEDYAGDF